jgi:quercetin dioxygenase-like cupin family protein
MLTPLRLALPLSLVAAVCLAADSKPPSTEDAQVAQLKDAKWAPPKAPQIPPGAMVSPIATDPASGGSVGYAKFPAGYAFPSHTHSATEYSTVVSGKVRFTLDGKAYDLEPGSYIVIPPKTHHQLQCGAGAECVVLTRRAGPTDYSWDK